MSTVIDAAYEGTPSLGSSIFIQIRNPTDGTIVSARSNGGIREDVAGCYVWSGTLADLEAYEAVWDEGTSLFAVEIIVPRPSVTVNITEGSPLPILGDANAQLLGKTFLIKRGDTLPNLRRQLQDTNGNAVVLDGTETIKFTMRASTDVAMASPAKTHADAVIIDAPNGIVEYQWVSADTNTSTYVESTTLGGHVDTPYAAEFEVNYADGSVETFPQADYIAVSIPPDLDPGTTP